MNKKVKPDELNNGDVIWNDNTKFNTKDKSTHPTMYLDGVGYSMTSSKDRYNDRVEYNKDDIKNNQSLGTMYFGKYITKYTNELDKDKEYKVIFTIKRSFINKFRNWLKTGKFE